MKSLTPDDIRRIEARSAESERKILFDGIGDDVWLLAECKWLRKFDLKFSIPIKREELSAAYEQGLIRKRALIDGRYYWGTCRNAHVARWSAMHQRFFYNRKKGGWSVESAPHPEDEEVFPVGVMHPEKAVAGDIFSPWLEVEPLDFERIDIPSVERG